MAPSGADSELSLAAEEADATALENIASSTEPSDDSGSSNTGQHTTEDLSEHDTGSGEIAAVDGDTDGVSAAVEDLVSTPAPDSPDSPPTPPEATAPAAEWDHARILEELSSTDQVNNSSNNLNALDQLSASAIGEESADPASASAAAAAAAPPHSRDLATPRFTGLTPWPYIALAVLSVIVLFVLCYATYNFLRSLKRVEPSSASKSESRSSLRGVRGAWTGWTRVGLSGRSSSGNAASFKGCVEAGDGGEAGFKMAPLRFSKYSNSIPGKNDGNEPTMVAPFRGSEGKAKIKLKINGKKASLSTRRSLLMNPFSPTKPNPLSPVLAPTLDPSYLSPRYKPRPSQLRSTHPLSVSFDTLPIPSHANATVVQRPGLPSFLDFDSEESDSDRDDVVGGAKRKTLDRTRFTDIDLGNKKPQKTTDSLNAASSNGTIIPHTKLPLLGRYTKRSSGFASLISLDEQPTHRDADTTTTTTNSAPRNPRPAVAAAHFPALNAGPAIGKLFLKFWDRSPLDHPPSDKTTYPLTGPTSESRSSSTPPVLPKIPYPVYEGISGPYYGGYSTASNQSGGSPGTGPDSILHRAPYSGSGPSPRLLPNPTLANIFDSPDTNNASRSLFPKNSEQLSPPPQVVPAKLAASTSLAAAAAIPDSSPLSRSSSSPTSSPRQFDGKGQRLDDDNGDMGEFINGNSASRVQAPVGDEHNWGLTGYTGGEELRRMI